MDITHNAEEGRFEAAGEHEAYLAYDVPRDGIMDLTHTYVAPEERNKGVGESLARYALHYAQERNYQVIPSCPFVRKWIGEHPQYEGLVTNYGFGTEANP